MNWTKTAFLLGLMLVNVNASAVLGPLMEAAITSREIRVALRLSDERHHLGRLVGSVLRSRNIRAAYIDDRSFGSMIRRLLIGRVSQGQPEVNESILVAALRSKQLVADVEAFSGRHFLGNEQGAGAVAALKWALTDARNAPLWRHPEQFSPFYDFQDQVSFSLMRTILPFL